MSSKIAWNKGLKGFRKGENNEGKNGMWKGDKVGLKALHEWVHKRIARPELCTRCNKRKAIDLANKGIYNRELKNWEWLCRYCHMKSDGRLTKLIKKSNNMKGKKQTDEHIKKRIKSRDLSGFKQLMGYNKNGRYVFIKTEGENV